MNDRLEKVEIPFNDFKKKLDANSKVLFSGVFGSGKTTFLNDFFLNDNDYQAIHLYPVSYSVVSNKDIFELIKYDILFQLLGKISKEDFEKVEIPYHLTLFAYLTSNQDLESKADFFASFLSFAGKYGNVALKVYGQIKRMKTDLLDYHKKFQQDDFKFLEEYLKVPVNETGHVYEEDFYTELIRILLEKLKEKGENKKTTVLVVDDLDRLDPEHIFRILNVFSCHFDFRGVDSDNKFDFDKVLLVCDYKNIESVFSHKYGSYADFSGYIDKFYSSIYWYSPSEYLNKVIVNYLNSIKIDSNSNFFNNRNKIGGQIKYLISQLIRYDLLTFREILKFEKFYDGKGINYNNPDVDSILKGYNFIAVSIIQFFKVFMDNDSSFLLKIKKAKEMEIHYGENNSVNNGIEALAELVLFLNYNELKNEEYLGSDRVFIKDFKYNNYIFNCRIVTSLDYDIGVKCDNVQTEGEDYVAGKLSYFSVFYDAIIKYNSVFK